MEDSQSRCSLCFWLITAQHQDGHMQDKFNSLPILLSFSFSMTNTKAISNSENFQIYYFVIFPWGWFSSGWKSTPRKQPEFENPILRFDSQFGSSAVFFLFFFYFLILGCRNFFSNPIFLVVFLSPMCPFPWTESYWQCSSSSPSLVLWNTCGMTKEGLQVMQSPTSFNKPCSPTPPTIPIALTQTELAHSATFFATWIRDQQSNVVQWRMFSLDSCKLPLPSIPNTKPNTNCKKNNRLDWSHPSNPPSNCRISRSFQHSWVL